jgi:peptidoglycan/xylan/chitin deacetylase (PgdA/CDA1 family)
MRTIATMILLAAALVAAVDGHASPCSNPDALGTARVLEVSAAQYPRVGRKHFPQTLPLAPKEVVLTFDDGPEPGSTARVLDALRSECVHATFFLVGRQATQHPGLAQRIAAEGHSIGYHSYSHPILSMMMPQAAEADIDRGIAAVDRAVWGKVQPTPASSFFRFPGFAATPLLLDRFARRGMVVFGADIWASDWNEMTPQAQLALLMDRLQAAGGGIILMHDTRAQTAAMLPAFLRALKTRGYRVVHVVSADRLFPLAVAR